MDNAKTILLAEHDPFLINVYTKEFRKAGYNTSIVSNEEIVLKRIRNINPDLMILDASFLPALKLLREDIMLKDLRVVMLHNFSHKENPEKFFRLGVEKHFSKAENTAEEIVGEIKRMLN